MIFVLGPNPIQRLQFTEQECLNYELELELELPGTLPETPDPLLTG